MEEMQLEIWGFFPEFQSCVGQKAKDWARTLAKQFPVAWRQGAADGGNLLTTSELLKS